jgi:hypothetical protein
MWDLLFVVDSRHTVPALRFLTHPGSFGDDQSCACTLGVVLDHKVIRYMSRVFCSRE